MAGFIGQGKVQFLDNNGHPLAGGQVWVYLANSTTLTNTYNDIVNATNEINPQANPVPLDSRGEAIIIINTAVKLVIEDSNINPSTGHGNVIWSINNFAVADAEEFDVGEYHFQGNTVADGDNTPAFSFNAVTNAIRFIQLNAASSLNAPEILSVSNSGLDDVDLHIRPQLLGSTIVYNQLKVLSQSPLPSYLNVAPSAGLGAPVVVTVGGTVADVGLTVTAQGAGAINITSPLTTANIAVTGTTTLTGNTTSTGNIVNTGNISTTGSNTAASSVLTNSGFTYTITPGTLAANKTMVLPSNTQLANQAIVTDGSSNLTYGYPSRPSVLSLYQSAGGVAVPSSGTAQSITYDTVLADVNTTWNAGTKRWTPGIVGYWQVACTLVFNTPGSGTQSVTPQLFKNGSLLVTGSTCNDMGNSVSRALQSVWTIHNAVITDYYEFKVTYINSGAAGATQGQPGQQVSAHFLHV